MARPYHFLMFVACEKNMAKTNMYQDKVPNISINLLKNKKHHAR
jgi:hypothetical protein